MDSIKATVVNIERKSGTVSSFRIMRADSTPFKDRVNNLDISLVSSESIGEDYNKEMGQANAKIVSNSIFIMDSARSILERCKHLASVTIRVHENATTIYLDIDYKVKQATCSNDLTTVKWGEIICL